MYSCDENRIKIQKTMDIKNGIIRRATCRGMAKQQ